MKKNLVFLPIFLVAICVTNCSNTPSSRQPTTDNDNDDDNDNDADTTAPTIGSAIAFSAVDSESITVTVGAATDDVTSAADLEYKIVFVETDDSDIDTIGEVEALSAGQVLQDWTANSVEFEHDSLTQSHTYCYAVLVKDEAGNKSIYAPDCQDTDAAIVKKMYVTASNYWGGSLAAAAGADAKCMADANYPGSGTYKAMVAQNTVRVASPTPVDWVLLANASYTRLDGTPIGSTGADRMFVFPLTNPVSASAGIAWTGMLASGISGFECTDWGDNVSVSGGEAGDINATTNQMMRTNTYGCGGTGRLLYCVEQ